MKRTIFTFCIAIFSASVLFAQENMLLEDFEDGNISFTDMVNINPEGSIDTAIVENPVKEEVNMSDSVLMLSRVEMEENMIWAGFWATLTEEIPGGYDRIEIKYMRTNATSQLRMKVEGGVTLEFDPVTPATLVNEWETLVFDLAGNGITNITVLSLFPDFYEPVDVAAVSYIDDIMVIYDGGVEPPPSLVLFTDSEDDRFFDNSVVIQTAPSMVLAEPFEIGGAVADKLPVVTDPMQEGTNALQLQWTSAESGDWMALVASIGWTSFNLTDVGYLNFWVNSPVDMATTALPMIFLESHSGTPNQTGRLMLADYLETGLMANTWTEVHVPLADFWDADPLFVSSGVVKGLFFAQNEADNVEHTLYLDNFSFGNMTSVDGPLAKKQIKAYYYNGELRIADYAGLVRVYDLVGKKVAEGNAFNGKMKLNLNNGIYIISTSKGNTKIALQ